MEYKIYNDYTEWKNWTFEQFGSFHKDEYLYFRSELSFINKQLRINECKILELGFGQGAFLGYCKYLGLKVTGVELNNKLLSMAKDKGFEVFDWEWFMSCEEKFDLIVAFDVLEHLSRDELHFLFQKINVSLNVGGYFLARFPNGDSPIGMANQNGDHSHKTFIGSAMFEYFSRSSNLHLVSIRPESLPLIVDGLFRSLRRIFIFSLRSIIDMIMTKLYFPGRKVFYAHLNIVGICKKM